MKKALKSVLSLLLVLLMIFSFAACEKIASDTQGEKSAESGLWENAIYTQDTQFGSGGTTIKVEVKAGDKSITFTIKTDKETVGEALLEHDLIAGDKGEYGLYVKVVNGITADYDFDRSYWAFYKDGEMMNAGVDDAKITDGEHYELVYTK